MRRYQEEHLRRRRVARLTLTLSARKPGEQTGLDTPVVLALNDEYLVSGVLILRVPSLTFLVFRLGSTLARVKLKGIDGDPHKRWSMWFNSTQREEPYLD